METVTPVAQERAPDRNSGKSPSAFRTIAEVASDLQLPAHVLRFWESKFPQIKPLKRRGGRRYYRPEDVILLKRIRSLLYTEGYTIKGVQRLLREGGGRGANADEPEAGEEDAGGVVACQPAQRAGSQNGNRQLRLLLTELEELRALLRRRGF